MKLFDGLYLYEIVLLVLGVLLFLALLIAFLVFVFRGRPYRGLLVFFAIPIVMIGYPSIKSIEFDKDVVKIEKFTRELKDNPTDPAVRNELGRAVNDVAGRPSSRPAKLAVLGSAQFALGNESAASETLQKAIQADPKAPEVLALQHRIEIARTLDRLATQVESDPNDAAARAELSRTLSEASQMQFANPQALTNIARAEAVVGSPAKAREHADKALAIDPSSHAARRVKMRIDGTLAPTPNP